MVNPLSCGLCTVSVVLAALEILIDIDIDIQTGIYDPKNSFLYSCNILVYTEQSG